MIRNFLKRNNKCLFIFIAIFILILITNITNSEMCLDNTWNFHMIQKVNLGYIPYKEINILITPLFHYLGSFFMGVFGESFLAFFIYGSSISATIAIFVYKILRKITDKIGFIMLGMALMVLLLQYLYLPNYNLFIFVWVLLLILMEWKKEALLRKEYSQKAKKKIPKYDNLDYIIGIIMALCFLTKQTVGAVFDFTYLIYSLACDKINLGKVNWKVILRKIAGAMFIMIPFLLYLLATNSFIDFIDLCFGGIIDFGSKNSTGSFFVWQVLLVVAVFIFCYQWFSVKKDKKALLLGLFTSASLIIAYPLMNEYHLYLAMLIAILGFIYILEIVYNHLENNTIKIGITRISYICGIGCFFGLIMTMTKVVINFEPLPPPDGLEVYYGCNVDKKVYNEILEVNDYIKEKEQEGYNVYIMSAEASKYMIPMKRNNNKYDLILQGNLGYKGEERLLEEIKKIERPLLLKTEELIFQESVIVDDYIKENYNIIDRIGEFNVYTEK